MRPRVIINMAPSLDGKIAPVRRLEPGRPLVMSRHEEDPKRLRALRESSDAVLIGAGNLRLDDPDLAPSKLRVVVTRAGEGVEPGARMFARSLGGEAIVAHTSTMEPSRRALLRTCATMLEVGASEVEALQLLSWLARERGCRVVVCEGGAALNASLLAARAVDEVRLTVVPRVLGGSRAPGIFGGDGFDLDAVPDARLVSVERVGDELFVVYAFDASST